jgi:phenylacetate-coenzyme A ligase PaaK-like adenylate-forming protein
MGEIRHKFCGRTEKLNRPGITLEQATEVALRAERERDFRPELPGGVTAGLSSGTSGRRHVFLAGRGDRCRWAGFRHSGRGNLPGGGRFPRQHL